MCFDSKIILRPKHHTRQPPPQPYPAIFHHSSVNEYALSCVGHNSILLLQYSEQYLFTSLAQHTYNRCLTCPSETMPDETLYLYTSLSAGSSHIVTATSRIETILKANKIPFKAVDCATDDKARMIWQRRSKGKKLPGLVKYQDVVAVRLLRNVSIHRLTGSRIWRKWRSGMNTANSKIK